MSELSGEQCTVCRGGEPQATDEEIRGYLTDLPGWEVHDIDGVRRLVRVFPFRNFKSALAFTDRVGAEAETQGHHPALLTEWGKVTVSWWTHAIGGLHKNDFVMAARTDKIAAEARERR